MIDTNKYKGHTPAPWKLHYDDSAIDGAHLDYGAQLDPVGALHAMSVANARLITDAPLLLEEVKRLQGYEREHKELWDIIANFSPKDSEEDNDTYQEWLDSVSQGYMGSVYEYVMMKQEEMIE